MFSDSCMWEKTVGRDIECDEDKGLTNWAINSGESSVYRTDQYQDKMARVVSSHFTYHRMLWEWSDLWPSGYLHLNKGL